ncbi:DUF4249 domain-containing protein [Pedobacter psychroterrae]|uniref:DUF4249 domain-containing protein n=1 Tax=Pedobacter psychroterrae TaxID=2530453 RepID=A0A4R0NCW9_9SPHI|nr:DUF4249 domain-containing protein [Pedobacter psychroterrae]TCC98189.1 DUF4249 domain-containing protein [Pedobacter psychroterrae]
MRLTYTFLTGLFAAVLLLTSCEKIITLELDNAGAAVVIDAGLSDQGEIQVVRLSKTYDFTQPNKFNGASGATVVLTSNTGNVVNYTEVEPGIYNSPRIRGRSGVKYTLTVNLEGKTYIATSTMPDKVHIDSLTFKDYNFFGEKSRFVDVNYLDPRGAPNYYRYILRVKGKIEEDVVSEDRFNDGNEVANTIFYDLSDLERDDQIDVEFLCIDRNVYRYFYSLSQNMGGGGPPIAPSNPPSNFSNGALGVFSAYTSSRRTATIPD